MNRFKKEPHISQRKGRSGLWTFQVFIRTESSTITKSFSEKDYGNARIAYETAITFRNKVLDDVVNNSVLRLQNLTVNDLFEDYQETTTDSYSTKLKHRKLYNKYIQTKDIPIQSLTKANIIADLNALTSTCSDDTIARVYSIYKNDIVLHALNNEYINRDLMAGIKRPQSRIISKKKSTVTDRHTILEVERRLLESNVNKYNAKLIVFLIELLYYTGMRPAEAEALTRDDIKDGFISITKQLGSDKDNFDVITKCKTTNSVRNVPIHPQLEPILEDLLDFSRYDELFRKDDGHYLNSSYVGAIFRNILKDTGIEFNLYRLRHNMATTLIVNGTDTKTTMELLGHAQYNMSLGYANSNTELKDKAIKLLS